jgi:ResB protein required for cytochrome c biosynthesis
MTETVRGTAIGRAEQDPSDGLDGGLSVSPNDIGERLWRFFISMKTGLVLILALAVLGFIGTMLMQAPPGLQGDPQAYATWVESLRPKYGGWTGILDTLGLFSIFSSVWFRGIMVLLMTSILACSANRAPHLWKLTVHPRTDMSKSFFEHAPLNMQATGAAEPATAAAIVKSAFGRRHFRTIVHDEGDMIHLYADHFRWGPFGTVIAHLSLGVILIGVLVGSAFGFHNNSFAVAVGSTVDVGNGTGLSVEAKSFSDSYYTNGSPSDYASELVVYRDGQQVGSSTIRVNQPMRVGDVTFYQSYFGAAAAMKVVDAAGKVLLEQGVPLEWSYGSGTRQAGLIPLPEAGVNMYVVAPRSGEVDPTIKAGEIQVEVYKAGVEGAAIASQVLTQGQPAELAGLTVTFERERQFTGLIVAKDPGAIFVWLGSILLVLGTALVFFFPCRRAWALIRRGPNGSTVHVGAVIRHDVGFEAEFQRLAAEIQDALAGQANTEERVG